MRRAGLPLALAALAALERGAGALEESPPGTQPPSGPGPCRWEVRGTGVEGRPGFSALRDRAESALRDALRDLRGGLGRGLGPTRVVWVLDASSPAGPARGGGGGAGGPREVEGHFAAGGTAFEGASVRVSIPARRYLRRPEELATVVRHEAAHAALASSLGSRERYRAVPAWLREGTALWFSGEGEVRLGERIADTVFRGGAADVFLVGLWAPGSASAPSLPGEEGNAVTPEEAWLAVSWIEGRVGRAGVRLLFASLADGRRPEEFLPSLLGKTLDAIAVEALSAARSRVREMLPQRRERKFRESLSLRDAGRRDEAVSAWRDLLAEDPQGALASTARYLIAKEMARRGGAADLAEARGHAEAILSRPGDLWRPEALLILGDGLRSLGREAEARAAWEEVLDAFEEDAVAGEAARARLR